MLEVLNLTLKIVRKSFIGAASKFLLGRLPIAEILYLRNYCT